MLELFNRLFIGNSLIVSQSFKDLNNVSIIKSHYRLNLEMYSNAVYQLRACKMAILGIHKNSFYITNNKTYYT